VSFEFKLAWKYFRARRKSLARFTSLVAVVGIAAGVASLIIAQALARGFADEMQDKILGNTAHVSVFSSDGGKIDRWREIKEKLERLENVKEVSATSYENAMIIGSETVSYAVLKVSGFTTQVSGQSKLQTSDDKFQNVKQSEIADLKSAINKNQIDESNTEDQKPKSEDPKIEISIGKILAEKTGLKSGDGAEIIVLENQSKPKREKVIIKEVFQTGLYEYDSTWISLSGESFASLHGEKNFTPTVLSVSVKDIYDARATAREIEQTLAGGFKVLDWQEANQPLFAALSLERKVSLAIISLIIFIAALNITTTLALLVNERKLDIAVLRTCGAKTRNLVSIFLLEGLFLGFLGIFAGVGLGLLGCFLGNRFKIINLSAEVYSLSYIPFHPDFFSLLMIVLIAFILCLAATAYPSLKASRIKPLENLRAQ
jgi:lipoprotein-releasing system permease protein